MLHFCSESNTSQDDEKKTKVQKETVQKDAKSSPEVDADSNSDFATIAVAGVLPGLGSYNDNSSDSNSDSSDVDSDDLKQVERIVSMRKSKKH